MNIDFFPPRPESHPTIYAYEDTNPQYAGLLKVGYTTVDIQTRVAQQYPTKKPGPPPSFTGEGIKGKKSPSSLPPLFKGEGWGGGAFSEERMANL